jgi:glutamate-5-semialdehyde dehydrogenase
MLDAVSNQNSVEGLMLDIGRRARAAARPLAIASTDAKNKALLAMAEALVAAEAEILAANAADLKNAAAANLAASFVDRLTLNSARVAAIAQSMREIAELPDPVGSVITEWDRPNGLHIERVRTPLGVIGVIYESRPNVTADAGALCLKAGNAVILRGGSDSVHSARRCHPACADHGSRRRRRAAVGPGRIN